MKPQSVYQVVCGCTLIVSVLGSSLYGNKIWESLETMNKNQALMCNNHCAFGFVADVEGELTCRCFDPCSTILCLQGTECVAEMPKFCNWDTCRPITRCQERKVVQTVKKPTTTVSTIDRPSQDAPWWSPGDITGDVCSRPLPADAKTCTDKRKRWHYNAFTGKCERFYGCPTHGNNFARKRYCKEQCRFRYMEKGEIKAVRMADDKICFDSLPSSAFTCSMKSKRWHYNAQTGKCETFYGCFTHGNNFSKKVACKAKCLRKKTYSNFLKGFHSKSVSAR